MTGNVVPWVQLDGSAALRLAISFAAIACAVVSASSAGTFTSGSTPQKRGQSMVESWCASVMPVRAAPKPRPSIVSHIAGEDLLRLYSDACPNYKRIADLTKLSKSDLSKISRVAGSSVRFDAHIPEPAAERLREIANIANLVGEFFAGDERKVALWFEIANPMLGNISPSNLIRIGKQRRLLSFVVSAREAENATPQ